jgi:tetratricopeptide (TPR) repeat protein
VTARRRAVLRLVAILLVVPFVAEAAYRAVLFLRTRSAAPKGDVFEIYAVGESTMMGAHTRPKISIPALAAAMFENRIGDRPIVVHMLARAGHPLYAQLFALSEATAFRHRNTPGAMIVYSGHNEGHLGSMAENAVAWQPTWYQRLERWSLLAHYLHFVLIDLPVFPVRPELFRRTPDLKQYEYELRATIETATRAGLVPMLATAAGNESGIEPSFGGKDGERARAAIEAALQEQQRAGCGGTERRCRNRTEADADIVAQLCYEAGKCVQAVGDVERAKVLYAEAIDLDARNHWGRATPAQNALIRRLTTEYRIPLVDTVAIFEKASPSGILGNELFVDGQHPGLMGQILIAQGFASAIARSFDVSMARPFSTEREAMAVFNFTTEDESASHVLSASWLMGMAAQHPWPEDALALAEAHTRAAIALSPDYFTAWFDLAIIQAARRGGLLRDEEALKTFGNWRVFFGATACLQGPDLDVALQRLRVAGADPEALERIGALRDGACRANSDVAN